MILLQPRRLQRLPPFVIDHTSTCVSMLTIISQSWFRLFPFRSPLLREWIRFSFSRDVHGLIPKIIFDFISVYLGYKMFKTPQNSSDYSSSFWTSFALNILKINQKLFLEWVLVRENVKWIILFIFLWVLRCFTSPGALPLPMYSEEDHAVFPAWCFHIRISPDQRLLATSPKLFAGCYVLHRHVLSSHPPYALINALQPFINSITGKSEIE